MTRPFDGTLLLGAVALASLLPACGPTRVVISPRDVVDVSVRPASGQLLFCPGDPFQVEVLAKLKNGTSCSSTDRKRGCLTEKDAVIDAANVRVEGSSGGIEGDRAKFIWNTSHDPLLTASDGVTLKGWIEQATPAGTERSMVGEARLKPVYACRTKGFFGGGSGGSQGENGANAPDLDIAVTTLSTPFYADAALIRVIHRTERVYYISPSPEQPIQITAAAQDGGQGVMGESGTEGTAGKDASDACAKGGNGEHGTRGHAGSNGGNGGDGGRIRITLDAAAADRLHGRILATSLGGDGGAAGTGGVGGKGGAGGRGGASGPSCAPGSAGDAGRDGANGPSGHPGYPGANGPPPAFSTASRAAMFGTELESIRQIEATQGQR